MTGGRTTCSDRPTQRTVSSQSCNNVQTVISTHRSTVRTHRRNLEEIQRMEHYVQRTGAELYGGKGVGDFAVQAKSKKSTK